MTKPVDCVQISSFLYRLKGSLLINAPLKNHTTMRVGGPATLLYYPVQQEDLIKAIQFLNKAHTEWMIAGNMSNTIFSDKGYSGCLISLKKMNHFYFEKTVLVANAGAMWPTLCKASMEKDLGGLEFTCGIPGTVGAGVRINAGAEGHEVSDILIKTTTCDNNGNIHEYKKEELDLSYRSSNLITKKEIILEASFELSQRPKNDIQETIQTYLKKREATQPINHPSSGSVFKNPPGQKAAQLIEQCGLKGLRIGDAQVSEKHANFIVNRGQASYQDILQIIRRTEETVFQKFSIRLEREVDLIK